MIYWYKCHSCDSNFSWVFTGSNDAKRCVRCRSTDIERIRGYGKKELIHE